MMNKKRTNILFFLLFIILSTGFLSAQNNDFGIWIAYSFKKKLSDKIRFSFDEEIRFKENVSSINKYYYQPGIKYTIIKPLKIALYYRYGRAKKLSGHYSNQHGLRVDLSYKADINRIGLLFRTRFQTKYSEYFSSESGKVPDNYSRNKITVSYDIRKSPIQPFFSFEAYYPLNNPETKAINKLRYVGGLDYQISKKIDVSLFYLFQKEINSTFPLNKYIMGVRISYMLK